MTTEEIISFMKSGDMCKEFGCTMERINYQGGIDGYMSLKCKYCKRDAWADWTT